MTLPTDPAARHDAVVARFQDVIAGVTDWDVPAPVGDWTARDIVAHLVEWAPALLAPGGDVEWPAGPSAADDPAAAFAHQSGIVAGLLADPEITARTFRNEHFPPMPFGQVIDRFYTSDVFMHTWDLARATGQDDTLDAEHVHELYAGMKAEEQMIRGSGQFGDEQPVRDDATEQERFIAFIGRDPYWTPGA